MTTVPSNLIPTTITQLPEYSGASTAGYLPYVLGGVTYKVQFSNIAAVGRWAVCWQRMCWSRHITPYC